MRGTLKTGNNLIALATREKAAEHLVSYVIVPADRSTDLFNLDRWYERDGGDQVGGPHTLPGALATLESVFSIIKAHV